MYESRRGSLLNDPLLYDNILSAVRKLLNIVTAMKCKLDEFLKEDPTTKGVPEELQAEFITELLSHLTYTTDKMVHIVPDLTNLSKGNNSNNNNCKNFLQELLSIEMENIHFVVSQYVSIIGKQKRSAVKLQSQEFLYVKNRFDELMSHTINTVTLLEKSQDVSSLKVSNLLNTIHDIVVNVQELFTATIEVQSSIEIKSRTQLLDESVGVFERYVRSLIVDEDLFKKLIAEEQRIISYILACVEEINQKITEIPLFAEQHKNNILSKMDEDLFALRCDLQQAAVGYPKLLHPKVEILDLSTRNVPLIKPPSVTISYSYQPQSTDRSKPGTRPPEKIRKKSISYDQFAPKQIPSLLPGEEKQKKGKKKRKTKEPLLGLPSYHKTLPDLTLDKIPKQNSSSTGKVKTNIKKSTSSECIANDTITKNDFLFFGSPRSSPLHSPASPPTSPSSKKAPPFRRKAELKKTRSDYDYGKSDTIDSPTAFKLYESSKKDNQEGSFISKRPKKSIKTKNVQEIFTTELLDNLPEDRLCKVITKIFENELPWFKEQWESDTDENKLRTQKLIQENIKRELVQYGNKIRGATTPRSPKHRKSITPRAGTFIHSNEKNSSSLQGFLSSTSQVLAPLEIPRLKACIPNFIEVSNAVIEGGYEVINVPQDELIYKKLSEIISDFYDQLHKIAKLITDNQLVSEMLRFLEQAPLEAIKKAPREGKIDSDFITISGEEYQLKAAGSQLRRQIHYAATSFLTIAFQISSTILSISNEAAATISDIFIFQLISQFYCQLTSVEFLLDLIATSRSFTLLLSCSRNKLCKFQSLVDIYFTDTNIWKSAPISNNSDALLGDLNSLVILLTETEKELCLNNTFMKAFLVTYHSFTTPAQLFRKLVERYFVPPAVNESLANKIRLRVIIVLKYWIESQFSDINHSLLQEVIKFVSTTIKASGHAGVAERLEKILIDKANARKVISSRIEKGSPPLITESFLADFPVTNPAEIILHFSPVDIAQHITSHESEIYQAIEVPELLRTKKPLQSANVHRFIRSVNKVSFWVASIVLWHSTVVSRSRLIEKFIDIAKEFREIGNFNSLMGVIGGLNLVSISRLTSSFAGISDKHQKIFKNLHGLMMSPTKYREALKMQQLPKLPYLGYHLADLAKISDGNEDIINGLINFDKYMMIYNVLDVIIICKQQKYQFQLQDPLKTFTFELVSLPEDDLWNLSKILEPAKGN